MKPIFELVFEFATIATVLMIALYIFKAHYFEKIEEEHNSTKEYEESLVRKHLAQTLRGYLYFEIALLVSLFLFIRNFEQVLLQGHFDWKVFLLTLDFGIILVCSIGVLVTMLTLIFSTYASILETIEEIQEDVPE